MAKLIFLDIKSRHRCNSIGYHHGDFEQLTGNSEATPYRLEILILKLNLL